MDDFTVFSEDDKQQAAYLACVGGMTLAGMAVGRFGGLPGLFWLRYVTIVEWIRIPVRPDPSDLWMVSRSAYSFELNQARGLRAIK